MAKNQQTSTFSNMFPTFGKTQEQVFAEQTSARMQAALAANNAEPERYAGEHALEDSGVGFGQMLGNFFEKRKDAAKRNPEQAKLIRAKEFADEGMKTFEAEGRFLNSDGEVDAGKKAWYEQSLVAESLMQQGDMRGYQLAEHLTEQKILRDKAEDERDKDKAEAAKLAAQKAKAEAEARGADAKTENIPNETAIKQQTADAASARAASAQRTAAIKAAEETRENYVMAYPMGATDPNAGQLVYRDPKTGQALRSPGGAPIPEFREGFKTERPDSPDDKFQKLVVGQEGFQTGVSQKDSEVIRNQQLKILTQMRLADRTYDLFKEVATMNGGTRFNFLGGGGKFVGAVTRMVDNINSVVGTANRYKEIVDKDGKVIARLDGKEGSAMRYMEANKGFFGGLKNSFESLIPIPDEIRNEGPTATARYRATIVQLAYAQAQINEPGTGRLSDADFKNALLQIGGAATNPDELRRVLYSNVNDNIIGFKSKVGQYTDINRKAIFAENTDTAREYDEAVKKFRDTFSYDWSEEGAASPALMNQVNTAPQKSNKDRLAEILNQTAADKAAYQRTIEEEAVRNNGN